MKRIAFLTLLLAVSPALAEDAAVKGLELLTNRAESRGDAAGGLDDLLSAIEREPSAPHSVLAADLLPRGWDQVPGGRAKVRKVIEKVLTQKETNGWARERYMDLAKELRLADGEKSGLAEFTAKRGYVRRWLAMGPFGHSTRSILDEVFTPEVDLRAAGFDPKARYETTKGMQTWSRVPFRPLQTSVDFARALRATTGSTYLVSHIESDEDREVVLTWDGPSAKVFVNRGLAATIDRHRLRLDNRVRFLAKLHKGWNRIVVKTGEWLSFFSLRIATRDGDSIPGLKEDAEYGGHDVPAAADSDDPVRPSWTVTMLSKKETPEERALYAYALLTAGLGEEGYAIIEDSKVQGPLASKAWFQVLKAETAESADHLADTQRRDISVKAYKQALKIDKDFVAAKRRLAEFDLQDEKVTQGLSGFEAIIEQNPKDHSTRLRLYNQLMDKGYEHDAELVLAEMEKQLPDSLAALGARGRWLEIKGDRVSLQKIFEKELEIDRRALWVIDRRKDLAVASGDAAAAKKALEAEIEASWELDEGEADLRRADLARKLDDRAGEIEHYARALEARPEDLTIREYLAHLLAEKGDEASAKRALVLLDDLLTVEPHRLGAQNLRNALRDKKDEFWKEWEYDAKDLIAGSPDAEKYGNAATVCLWDQTVTRIRKDGSSTEVIHQAWKILDEDGVEKMGKRPIHGECMAIKVFTPGGAEVLEPIRAGNSFEMPGLAPGAVIEHQFRVEHGPKEFQYTNGPWYLQDPELREPFVHSRWIVIAPKDMNLEVIEKNLEAASCKKTVLTRGDEVVRIWETFEQPRVEPEAYMPPKEEFLPWVKLYERRTLEELAGIYRDRTLGRTHVTPSIKAKADELCQKLESDTAKIAAIYSFVKEHVHQNGPAETASQILAQKAGSQTILMAALLDAAKVPFKWAFAALSPDLDLSTDWEHPEPFQFNRPLLRLEPRDGAMKYVSPQGPRYAPLDLSNPALWGAPVFVCDGASGTLDVLPRGNPAEQSIATRATVSLQEKGAVKASYTQILGTAGAYGLKEAIKNANKKQVRDQVAAVANGLFTGAKLLGWEAPKLEDPSVPFQFSLDLEAKDVVRKQGDGTLMLPPLVRPMELKKTYGGKATRKYDLILQNWFAQRDSVTLELGPYAAPRLPSDVQAESKFGQYSLVFVREGGKVRIERSLSLFPRRVSPSEYKSFLGFIDKVDAAERRPIVVELRGDTKVGDGEKEKQK
ncbi:MAG: hypothetical protein ACAI25_06435 [Planctomycetota bacterium]